MNFYLPSGKQSYIPIILLSTILFFACDKDDHRSKEPLPQVPEMTRIQTQSFEREQGGLKTSIQSNLLIDTYGRASYFRGINVSGSHKAPPTEDFPSLYPLPSDPTLRERCIKEFPWTEDLKKSCVPQEIVSYINRPFVKGTEDAWFKKIAQMGFNAVRLITNWESIQPYQPGDDRCVSPRYDQDCHDLEYLAYYEGLIQSAQKNGVYVLIDMHQDMFSRYLMSYYQEKPKYQNTEGVEVEASHGSIEKLLFSLLPPFNDWMRGHGAPKWVVQTCLPEKNMDSPNWGLFRGFGALRLENGGVNPQILLKLQSLLNRFSPSSNGPPSWFNEFLSRLPVKHFEPNETSDYLPLSPWLLSGILSLDVERCFAALFAGDQVFPNLKVDIDGKTKNIGDLTDPSKALDLKAYLQGQYEGLWKQLAQIGKKYDNVIGYDVMNEPFGVFIMLGISSLMTQGNLIDAKALLNGVLGEVGNDLFDIITGLELIPLTSDEETKKKWGLNEISSSAVLDLNQNFDANYLQKFYERMGQAIEAIDPNAVIWFEGATSVRMISGTSRFFDNPPTKPQGIKQLVFAPHWYPDIYPNPSIQSIPRSFNDDEWQYKDLTGVLEEELHKAPTFLGNVPVVFGEFGTYFNFNGIEESKKSNYLVSTQVLNRYYEAFEQLGVSNMLWCLTPENDYLLGDLWNREDFSIVEYTDPKLERTAENATLRGWQAYVRPYLRSSAYSHHQQGFNSILKAIDWRKSERENQVGFYTLKLSGQKISDQPSEVFIPTLQYPYGFHVYANQELNLSYDEETQILVFQPMHRDQHDHDHDLTQEWIEIEIEAINGQDAENAIATFAIKSR
jgi:hypothetical protein